MRKLFSLLLVSVFALSVGVPALALAGDSGDAGDAGGTIGLPGIPDVTANIEGDDIEPVTDFTLERGVRLIALVLRVAYIIFFIIAALFIIFAAWDYLQSGGGEGVAKAQKKLIYALIAIAIALLSFGITSFVSNLISRSA